MKLLNEKEIIKNKIKIDKIPIEGLYFLIDKNIIVYVGSSINIKQRILTHIKQGKIIFDSYTIVKIKNYREMEIYYIINFMPKYNKMITDNKTLVNKMGLITLEYFRKIIKYYCKENNIDYYKIPFTKTLNIHLKNDNSLYRNNLKSINNNKPKLALFYVDKLFIVAKESFADIKLYNDFKIYFNNIFTEKN
jgi:hypothetical protein